MSKQLGIGVRVVSGWTPDDKFIAEGEIDPRLKLGTIVDGPIGPGVVEIEGRMFRIGGQAWNVSFGSGEFWWSQERMLTPIDDDNESVTRLAELQEAN